VELPMRTLLMKERTAVIALTTALLLAAAVVYPLAQAGPTDKPKVDPEAAARGRTVWAAECITCHGTQARGTETGPNLLRSVIVLRDRYGSELGPFLKKGHRMQSGRSSTELAEAQVRDLANFLREQLNNAFRGSPLFVPGNVLTGDPKAGAEYFNGPGNCAACHSPLKDLAGIGRRYRPVDLQQRFLFPARGRGQGRGRGLGLGLGGAAAATQVTATVTPPSGPTVSGTLVMLDDFDVTIRDESGVSHTFRRTPALKIVKNDPLAAHAALLDTITDENIHDVVAYLETLK
jgi:cytochrome c oxidase cbb3-type subunit 3